ncbi:unnamed protein product [Bursaphelenchus okinawaensis]|uniref:guanylate cyclase n=1 Tax=Bursaphelenchus okinawaensis TaxID=465554 RepID=A0A811K892_9BILA|nr:unnamed protein product [Bursaphelenchus okinawaensis]CAG9094133.1 unnamed protein product [Bursaphelenchus okinawaensis]
MFGVIHECIKQLFISLRCEEAYKEVLAQAGFEMGKENMFFHYYEDSDSMAIIDNICLHTKMGREEIWELFGAFFVNWIMDQGWGGLLRTLSPDLKGFVNNLDSLHYFVDHVVYKANLKGPSFRCEVNKDDSITLHYFSERSGLYPIVKGIIREVGKKLYKLDVNITLLGRTQRSVQVGQKERLEEHVIFLIRSNTVASLDSRASSALSNYNLFDVEEIINQWTMRISQKDFCTLQPYHFIMDRDCRLVQIGNELIRFYPPDSIQLGMPILKLVEIQRPQIPLDYDNILNFINAAFVLQIRPQRSTDTDVAHSRSQTESRSPEIDAFRYGTVVKLKGQMMPLSNGEHMIYLGSPYVTTIPELLTNSLRLSSFPLHDATRDLILLNQQRLNDVDDNIQLEANNERLEEMASEIELEKKRNETLLKEVLPVSVAEQLLQGASVDAREYPLATVMFVDCPRFQTIVPLCQPRQLVSLLNDLFTKFDRLVSMHNVYKVETVGDSYMTCGGLPDENTVHCEQICHLALGMLWEAQETTDPVENQPLSVRCGVHSGAVVAGVIGVKMPRYCLFGDTVNTAARMESHSLVGRIHCSSAAKKSAEEFGRFEFHSRGTIPIKGKGRMETYFLAKSLKKSVWELIGRPRNPNIHSIDGYDELMHGIESDLKTARDDTKNTKTCSIL